MVVWAPQAALFTVVGVRGKEGCGRWKHPLTPITLCFPSPSFPLGSLGCPKPCRLPAEDSWCKGHSGTHALTETDLV